MQEISEDENSDSEIHVQIQPDLDPKIQKSECEISEGDEAIVQNATNVTDPAPIQQSNPENSFAINEDKFEVQYLDSGISKLENEALKIPEITASTTPRFNSEKQNNSEFQSQNDEDDDELDERTLYRELADRNATVVVDRPPPEPPDLHSVAVGEGELGSSVIKAAVSSRRPENLETVTAIHSGAEDGVVAKGNVVDVGSADLTRGSSAVVGASVEGMWTMAGRTTAATVAYGGILTRRLRWFVSLTPPPLLAVVFPWDRDGGRTCVGLQRWPESLVENRAKATANSGARWQRKRTETGAGHGTPVAGGVKMAVAEKMAVAKMVRARARVAQRSPPKPHHLCPVMVGVGEAATAVADGGFTGWYDVFYVGATPTITEATKKGVEVVVGGCWDERKGVFRVETQNGPRNLGRNSIWPSKFRITHFSPRNFES
ncbi:hypothetical protein PIB30_020452 [Stylosanthes scabra]|uniref:Uncharacterized protein n=1 Tax=Stylosanthes scabra TaxID=79078 RepID=A0ABU6U7U7_9FABA|nr:hypothetical protein [Stylosanthes scabra]